MPYELHPARRILLRTLASAAGFAVAWAGLTAAAQAANKPEVRAGITLPQGLTVTPPAKLDIVYQVVPSFDQSEKVLARWSGDKLQYLVTVAQLPEGWVQADKYFKGLRQDLTAAQVTVKAGRSGKYTAKRPLRGSYVEQKVKLPDAPSAITRVSHFLTDGKSSFVANATLMDASAADRMLNESIELLKTAALAGDSRGAAAEPSRSNETAYAGQWISDASLPDGRRMQVNWDLKPDLSFATQARIGTQVVMDATGTWRVQGQTIHSTYVRSQPPVPAGGKEDSDDITSFDGTTLVLLSKKTGRRTTYVRKPS